MHPELRKLPYSTSVWERGGAPHAWEIGLRRFRPSPALSSYESGGAGGQSEAAAGGGVEGGGHCPERARKGRKGAA